MNKKIVTKGTMGDSEKPKNHNINTKVCMINQLMIN